MYSDVTLKSNETWTRSMNTFHYQIYLLKKYLSSQKKMEIFTQNDTQFSKILAMKTCLDLFLLKGHKILENFAKIFACSHQMPHVFLFALYECPWVRKSQPYSYIHFILKCPPPTPDILEFQVLNVDIWFLQSWLIILPNK